MNLHPLHWMLNFLKFLCWISKIARSKKYFQNLAHHSNPIGYSNFVKEYHCYDLDKIKACNTSKNLNCTNHSAETIKHSQYNFYSYHILLDLMMDMDLNYTISLHVHCHIIIMLAALIHLPELLIKALLPQCFFHFILLCLNMICTIYRIINSQ